MDLRLKCKKCKSVKSTKRYNEIRLTPNRIDKKDMNVMVTEMKKTEISAKGIENSWHRLDNAGNLFPLITNHNFSNVFRVAAQLTQDIDPLMLQRALDETIPWFTHFQFRIKHGFFWNYFEKNKAPMIPVEEESGRPCNYIEPSKNQHYLYKVLYYKKRITLEVFHALTDGNGALEFLKALVVNYLRLKKDEKLILDSGLVHALSDTEDGYRKYYKKQKTDEPVIKNGFHVKGRLLPMYEIGIIQGYMDLDRILSYCKSHKVSLTIYLVAVYIWAIYKGNQLEGQRHKPIQIAVPVNLRRFFDTNTTMNFFSYITANLLASKEEITFETLIQGVKGQFEHHISREKFAAKIGKEVALRRNPFLRVTPLFIKNLFVRSIYISSMGSFTSTLSNIGQVVLPIGYGDEVVHFEFLLNPTLLDPIKVAVCSYENKLVVSFTSQIVQTDIQKEFFRKLSADGMDVQIESNGVYYENM